MLLRPTTLCNTLSRSLSLMPVPVRSSAARIRVVFQIPCVFPVRPQIFPVPIYIICDYYIHKTDLAELCSLWEKMIFFLRQIWQCPLLLELSLQNSLCFDKISKFPVFSLTGNFLGHFPCAVGTLRIISRPAR